MTTKKYKLPPIALMDITADDAANVVTLRQQNRDELSEAAEADDYARIMSELTREKVLERLATAMEEGKSYCTFDLKIRSVMADHINNKRKISPENIAQINEHLKSSTFLTGLHYNFGYSKKNYIRSVKLGVSALLVASVSLGILNSSLLQSEGAGILAVGSLLVSGLTALTSLVSIPANRYLDGNGGNGDINKLELSFVNPKEKWYNSQRKAFAQLSSGIKSVARALRFRKGIKPAQLEFSKKVDGAGPKYDEKFYNDFFVAAQKVTQNAQTLQEKAEEEGKKFSANIDEFTKHAEAYFARGIELTPRPVYHQRKILNYLEEVSDAMVKLSEDYQPPQENFTTLSKEFEDLCSSLADRIREIQQVRFLGAVGHIDVAKMTVPSWLTQDKG